MKVKICGITNHEDAVWALNYGADYLGLNFYKDSPRHASLSSVEKWVGQLPPFANLVGVFVNADIKQIVDLVVKLKLKGIQFHGDESPESIADIKSKLEQLGHPVFVMKAFRMESEATLDALAAYSPVVDYFLLDSFSPDQAGGTGKVFNWELAVKAKGLGRPVFLAGGLTPENVKDAVKKVMPFAVDVASGVEKSPKRKDPKKIQDFITNAKK